MKVLQLIILLPLLVSPGFVFAQEQKVTTGTSAVAVNPPCIELRKNMSYRARDVSTAGEVSILQMFLITKGYLDLEPTGFFGQATLSAVKKFQSASKILPTGYVGPLTRTKIKAISCIEVVVSLGATSSTTTATTTTTIAIPGEGTVSSKLVVAQSRLRIPKINVDAPIEPVGLTPDGIMDSPRGPNETGWYNLGSKPGEIGSAVIDGHSGWKDNIPAVFDNLHKLSKGDKIYVEDEKGVIVTFVVSENLRYDPKADASNVFGSNDGKAHLNLITCGGVWDKISRSSSERIIVFADRE